MTFATISTFAAAYCVGRIADQGASNFFGLATVRHGTHPLAWLSIHMTGALPQMGGNSTGGSNKEIASQNIGYFYMARGIRIPNVPTWFKRFYPRFIPRTFTFSSTKHLLEKTGLPSLITVPAAVTTAALLPPIRFRVPQDVLDYKMEVAPLMPEVAVRTSRYVSPFHIGTLGTFWNALTYKTPIRMLREPYRVLTGVAQLAIAAATAYYVYTRNPSLLLNHRTAIIAGAVLGMI